MVPNGSTGNIRQINRNLPANILRTGTKESDKSLHIQLESLRAPLQATASRGASESRAEQANRGGVAVPYHPSSSSGKKSVKSPKDSELRNLTAGVYKKMDEKQDGTGGSKTAYVPFEDYEQNVHKLHQRLQSQNRDNRPFSPVLSPASAEQSQTNSFGAGNNIHFNAPAPIVPQRKVSADVAVGAVDAIRRTNSEPDAQPYEESNRPMRARDIAMLGGFRREHMHSQQASGNMTSDEERILPMPTSSRHRSLDVFDRNYARPLTDSLGSHLEALVSFTQLANDVDVDGQDLFADYTVQEAEQLGLHNRPRAAPQCSVAKTCLSIFKGFIGTGILFVPRAYGFAGYISSIFMLAMSALLNYVGIMKLSEVHHLMPNCGYAQMAGRTLGNWAFVVIQFMLALSQFFFGVGMMVFVAQTVTNIGLQLGHQMPPYSQIYFYELIFLIPLGWIRRISAMKYTNLVGDFFIVGAILLVSWYGIQRLIVLGPAPDAKPYSGVLHSVPFIGTAVFAFEGIALIIPIRESMKEPDKFPWVMRVMIIFMFSLLAGFGFVCYLAWGSTVPSVALNAPDWSPFLCALQCGYIVAGFCGYPLLALPTFGVVENLLFSSMPFSTKRKLLKNFTRSCITFCSAIAAIVAGQNVELFISFVGATCCIPLACIFPAMIHHRACPGRATMSNLVLWLSGMILMPICIWQDLTNGAE